MQLSAEKWIDGMCRVLEAQDWLTEMHQTPQTWQDDVWPCGCNDVWHQKVDGVYPCTGVR